jgi:hypothetical protein
MADDNKSGSLASSGAVVAALAAMGLYYFYREAPRPVATDARIVYRGVSQTIDARLWQDPFAAVQKSIGGPGKRNSEEPCQAATSGDDPCKSPLAGKENDTLARLCGFYAA